MKKISVPPSMMGYTVMDGRLINESPEPVMGLSKMAQTRKAMKRAEKAEGNELAEANIDLFKKF